MTIKEVEKLTGLTAKSIRYYENIDMEQEYVDRFYRILENK